MSNPKRKVTDLLPSEAIFISPSQDGRVFDIEPIPTESDEVEVDKFDRALKLLKDLADLQNGAPIEQHRTEWEQTMDEVYTFLNQHKTRNTPNP